MAPGPLGRGLRLNRERTGFGGGLAEYYNNDARSEACRFVRPAPPATPRLPAMIDPNPYATA